MPLWRGTSILTRRRAGPGNRSGVVVAADRRSSGASGRAAGSRGATSHGARHASLTEVLERSHAARTRGWAYVHDSFEEGISAMATAVLGVDGRSAVGVVSIAGPSLQLTNDRMNELAAPLKAAAVELSGLTGAIAADINSRRLNHDEAVTA